MRRPAIAAWRSVWEHLYRPYLRDVFTVIEGRPVSDAEIDRWVPFEAIVAMGPYTDGPCLGNYVHDCVERRRWTSPARYWWPWTELDDWGTTP